MDITSTISETCQERLLNIEQKKGQEWLLKYRTIVWSGMVIELENKGKVRNGY